MLPGGGTLTPRQQAIIASVRQHGFATIEALALTLGVSGQTIRREVIRLEELGVLRRFHGGAGLPDNPVRRSYAEKTQTGRDGKDRIARRTAEQIAPGMAVFLDVGTTVEAVARALTGISPLRVFTNSLQAAVALAASDGIATFVTGGQVSGSDGSLTGEVTLRALGLVKCDVAVIGFSGFDPDGSIMDFDHDKIAVKRAMMRHARRVLLVGQAEKFGRAAVVRLGGIDEVDTIVTDGVLPDRTVELARQRGVAILTG
ncbi:DeoR/GlpR family DNA-binding transcription regulator [Sphingomonas hankookensis]